MVGKKNKRLRGTLQENNSDQQPRHARKREPKAKEAGYFSNFQIQDANHVNLGSTRNGPPILVFNMNSMSGERMSEFVYNLAIRLTGEFNQELSYENTGPDQSDVLFSQAYPLVPETEPGAYPNLRQRGRRGNPSTTTTRGQNTDQPAEKCPTNHTQQEIVAPPTRHEAHIDRVLEDQEIPEGQQQKKAANSKRPRPPQTQVQAGRSRNGSGRDEEKKDWRLFLRPRKK
ncbi:hypothetical protein F4782DRAFT_492096 [Xylaria castorea]|nr:hypothetical protein F4782DRAFT_492096 [Xylaria castorea]